MATSITGTPAPTSATSGPGQAPVNAQPIPKSVPPAPYLRPLPSRFGARPIGSPSAPRSRRRLMISIDVPATTIADAMMPYM